MFWNTFVKTKDNPFRLEAKKLNAEKEYLDFLSPIELKECLLLRFKGQNNRTFFNVHYNKYKLSLVACAMICIMLATGRRTISEVASLKWDNYKAGYKPSFVIKKQKHHKK